MPRPNGYQSLHTSVVSERGFPFEVQIRTLEMHRIAEEGIAAHWKYKEGRVGAGRDEQYFVWLRQLLEWQQEVRDPQEFLQNLKIELYPEEVYIFTPKGEVKALPRDATPVDFAYSIHTDVGHQCVGARVNGKMVPLRTRLRNGDIVEILTTGGTQAEPRLAELRRHLARAQQDQALHPRARRRRAASSSGGGCSTRRRAASALSPKSADRAGGGQRGARRVRDAEGRTSCSPRSATASCRRAPCSRKFVPSRAAEGSAGERASPRSCGGCSAPARTRSRCAASTTCWSSARAAAIRSAASRSSATSRAARASRCTRPPARTS